MILLYTDGSVLGNPGPGGWAYLYELNREIVTQAGGLRHTTNNIAELTAVIKGFESLLLDGQAGQQIRVISDSQYVIKGASEWMATWKRNGWRAAAWRGKGKPVKNREVWEELDALANQFITRWVWVRGHDGNRSNEECDRLAGSAARQLAKRLQVSSLTT